MILQSASRLPAVSRSLTIGFHAVVIALAVFLSLATAPRAEASPLVKTTTDCDEQSLEQPFLRWADPSRYVLAPAGTFGKGATGWQLSRARIVAENEPWHVHGDRQAASLRLDAGGSATSPGMCVGIGHPTLRFFARNAGSPLDSLNVEVLFEDATGEVRSLPIGVVAGHVAWSPTLPLAIGANLLPLLPEERTAVAFRFTATGDATWLIDDVYVDPYSK